MVHYSSVDHYSTTSPVNGMVAVVSLFLKHMPNGVQIFYTLFCICFKLVSFADNNAEHLLIFVMMKWSIMPVRSGSEIYVFNDCTNSS